MSQYCEHVAFDALAREFGTPLYVYSQAALTEALAHYQTAFVALNPLICYAVKANSNLSILRHFARLGCGFDIVSGGELARVLAAGGAAEKTIFSGVGKSVAEIEYALLAGIKCFNVESLPELTRIHEIAKRLGKIAPISLRINPDVDAKTHPYISTGLKENKFGIAMAQAESAYHYAHTLGSLKIVGIDCHIGSQLLEMSPLIEACERILRLVDRLSVQGIALEHVDLGGGVGIVYDKTCEHAPDLSTYATVVQTLFQGRDLALILEPGRSLVGNAGTLLTRVEYVKRGEGKNFVIVDAAMNDLLRPALYESFHAIDNNAPDSGEMMVADIVGPVCETGDFLAQNRNISAKSGDLLLVRSAGAYAASMASNYNTRGRAAEILVDGARVTLIKPRETWQEMLASEQACLR